MGDVQKVCKKDEGHYSELHVAAKRGDMESVRRLLRSSANVNTLDTEHNTPLHHASQNGHVDVVNLLLSKNPSVNSKNALDQTSLHPAVKQGRAGILENLMYNGANVNACNKGKMTALHLASLNGHTSIIEILLDSHATVDVMKQSDETPFYLAAKNGHAEVTDLLLRRGVCDFVLAEDKQTPLHVAVKKDHTEVVEVILKHSSRISGNLINCWHTLQDNTDSLNETSGIQPVELLRNDGRRLSAGIVWSAENKPLEIREDSDGRTALDIAAQLTQPKMVKLLLDAGQGRPAHSEGHLGQVLEHLREGHLGQDLEHLRESNLVTDCGNDDATAADLSDAEKCELRFEKNKGIAQALISSSKFNVNHHNAIGDTPLCDMITDISCADIGPGKNIHAIYLIQLLLEKGADFNLKNSRGETPLMIASKRGSCHAIQILFDWEQKSGMKLDLDARDQYGETALMKAVACNDECHDVESLDAWVHDSGLEFDSDSSDRYRSNPLIKAAESSHVSVMRLLLDHKASVNLRDFCGRTALHAAIYERKTSWFDLRFFCKDLRKQNIDGASSSLETSSTEQLQLREGTTDSHRLIDWLQCHIEFLEGVILSRGDDIVQNHVRREGENPNAVFHRLLSNLRLRLEAVKLLLDVDETNVNAIDFRGNSPLDLAMESAMGINSMSLKAPKDYGAIRKFHETPLEVARVDNRGRNPLHRLMIFRLSDCLFEFPLDEHQDEEQYDLMVKGILLNPETFRESATAKDNKGRTPLHYAVMSKSKGYSYKSKESIKMLLGIGSEVNKVDIYGKTPLHYAEKTDRYQLLVQCGADENVKDNFGNTPIYLKGLRDLVAINKLDNARIKADMDLYSSIDIVQVLKTNHVTELSRRKRVETIRIYSQSPRLKESPEEAIWRIWTENDFIGINRRLGQLKPSVTHFIGRLVDAIKGIDWRFECQPILVGSAEEETRVSVSGDFDFSMRLTKFSQICDPFPHRRGPTGYFELRRKKNDDKENVSDKMFDSFFNVDHCMLTDEVNCRFKNILEEVLSDPDLWQSEHQFDWDMKHKYSSRYGNLDNLCTNIRLRLLTPIEDGEGGFLFAKISIDIAACVHVENWWPEDTLPVGISPSVKTDGCTFVFHRPDFHLYKSRGSHLIFSETFTRISFAPLETRVIKESSPLIKAVYMVCKMILYSEPMCTYQLKNCLLFCMEALNAGNGDETKAEDKITPKQLAFWVERIMFCYTEFSRHHGFPCYFMPSHRQKVRHMRVGHIYFKRGMNEQVNNDLTDEDLILFSYCGSYDLYLDLCPDETAIDIPVEHGESQSINRNLDPNIDSFWERFDRKEFNRMLSSCRSHK